MTLTLRYTGITTADTFAPLIRTARVWLLAWIIVGAGAGALLPLLL